MTTTYNVTICTARNYREISVNAQCKAHAVIVARSQATAAERKMASFVA